MNMIYFSYKLCKISLLTYFISEGVFVSILRL